ncbi:TMEM143 family protein [Lolliginicoccus suaedae]|uniref:TMEM143 family protein n=1 Tax=Lolliginicoccus suaedae TaxID=2605429 RepID=UPI00165985FF|nr:TMEM143 family protein [Lolliginicoccus suaedae]
MVQQGSPEATDPAAERGAAELEHFIPFRKSAVITMCADELPEQEREPFRELATILASVLHHRFHARIERIKDAYHVLDPPPDLKRIAEPDWEDRVRAQQSLEEELVELAERANFIRVTEDEMQRAFDEESLIKVRLEVDRGDIDTAMFFRRGSFEREREVKSFFGLRRRTIAFRSYAKVLVYVTFRDIEHFADRDVEDLPFTPGSTMVKLFENVPRHDLEMLFPNVRVGMRPIDKLLIGVPAVISGIIVVVTKLIASLGVLLLLIAFWLGLRDDAVELDQAALVTIGAGLAAFGGYLVRQFNKFKNRKIQFMKALSENLYFRNLDNEVGVFHHLLDIAEEAEAKEAILSYHFLRLADGPLTAEELDQRIEEWFAKRWNARFDFEVQDGLRKLRELSLIEDRDGRLSAIPIEDAKRRLDERWDQVFDYNTSA